MLHAASPARDDSLLSLQELAEDPERLERGLKVVDVGLRIAPGFALDLVLKDRASRPVVVLGEGSGGAEALLGRGVSVLAEIRRMWSLLDRIFPDEGITFGTDPRLILVARRFSDALHGAAELLAPLGIDLVEASEMTIDGVKRLVIVKVGGAPSGAPSDGAAARAPAARLRQAAEHVEAPGEELRKKA